MQNDMCESITRHRVIQPGDGRNARKVLMIDDDTTLRSLARIMLAKHHIEVIEAAHGQLGLDMLHDGNFAAVILDLRMPDIDGFAVCRRIRSHAHLQDIPVMVVSGQDDGHCIEEAYESGATDFLSKPVNWVQVARKIELLITAKQNSQALQKTRNEQQALYGVIPDTLVRLSMNGTIEHIAAGGDCPRLLVAVLDALDTDNVAKNKAQCTVRDALQTLVRQGGEQSFTLADGNIHRHFQARASADMDGSVLVIIRDVTRERENELHLEQLAFVDAGTGLGNRSWIQERCTLATKALAGLDAQVEVFRIFVENADAMRELFNEERFELLMTEMSSRLIHATGACTYGSTSADTFSIGELGRSGPGEFTLVRHVTGTSEPAAGFAVTLTRTLGEVFRIDELELSARVRVGIATSQAEWPEAESLFQLAGIAALENAADGADICQYDSQFRQRRIGHLDLEARLRNGLRNGELSLHYQPQFGAGHGELTGFEALARWESEGVAVSPVEFIPVAESSGLILEMGAQVIDLACRQVANWRARGLAAPVVAVNLSPLQLVQGNLFQSLQDKLREYKLPPESIEVEITESSLMETSLVVQQTLGDIRGSGMKIALDDFGTGYSSLSYLHRYPLDVVKIDRSFVSGLPHGERSEDIIRTIVAMARAMGMQVVAEGVETREQLQFLHAVGCDFIQGYLTGKPLPAAQATRLLLDVLPDSSRVPVAS